MSLRPLKLLFLFTAAALEVSLLHLGVSLLTVGLLGAPGLNWLALLLVSLVGMATIGRFEPIDADRSRWLSWPTLTICVLTVAYGVKVQATGSWDLVSGWSVIWPFSDTASTSVLSPSVLLLPTLWAWWRGTVAADHDHGSIVIVLQRGVLTLVILTLLLTPTSNLGAPPWGVLLAAEAGMTIGIGLVCLSLAQIVAADADVRTSGWRWLRSSLGMSLLILIGGMLLVSAVSPVATDLLRSMLFALGSLIALVLAPIANAVIRLFESLLGAGDASSLPITPTPMATPTPDQLPLPTSGLGTDVIEWLVTIVTVLAYLLPLLALALLILLVRRRRRTMTADGAIHESLWSWRDIGSDVLDLLRHVRLSQRTHGLRDALTRLRGDRPAERIRRRYIEALLLAEARERSRAPSQTPLEFAPSLDQVAPTATPELHTLTDIYDRARYAPDTVDAVDADAADAAWAAIKRSATEENH